MAILKDQGLAGGDSDPPPYTERPDAVPASVSRSTAPPQQPRRGNSCPSSSSSSSCDRTKPRPLPSPNVSMYQKNSSICGHYCLNLSAITTPEPKNGYDAYFESHNGSVRVNLDVEGVLNSSRPVKIYIKSHNGNVTAYIRSHASHNQAFSIECISKNGSVYAMIPQYFAGPLNISSKNSSTKLFPQLLSRAEPRTESEYLIHPEIDGAVTRSTQKGVFQSSNGSVKVGFIDTQDAEWNLWPDSSSCAIS